MNYRKIYCKIIANAKSQNRSRDENHYYETHHILPKSLFPLWKKRKSNKVLLTAREHFFVHQLLAKIYPCREMIYALHAFVSRPNYDYKITSREYERIKIAFSKTHSKFMKDNFVRDEAYRENCSKSKKEILKNNPEVKSRLINNLNKGRVTYIENTKVRMQKMRDSCPNIIRGETLESLRIYHKTHNLSSTVYREKRVEYVCEKCGKLAISGLKFFICGLRNDFICSSCKTSERMKANNPAKQRSSR